MIEKASVSVYLGDNIIIVPDITDERGLWVSQYQDKVYSYSMTNTEFGKEILNKLEYSENSKHKNSKKHFWAVTGIKSYNTFCKKYKLILIVKYDDRIEIEVWYNTGKGYESSKNPEETVELLLPINPEVLGETVRNLALNSKDIDFENISKNGGFETADDSKVSYKLLPDEYIDIEDGHTDAYQIYIHEEYENNYIGFMIDTAYESFSSEDIKKTWTRWHGDLKSFKYKEIDDKEYYAEVSGKNKKIEKHSYLFRDGEEVLELTFEIDLVNTPLDLQEKIKKDFKKFVKSVKVVNK
ncbi:MULTISPECIES: hypothetical protein [unclassified Parvimonas]|uniref:hypothetical protein n=1 Tax=unclassified Parvimonas TaxID=1151464 RepID=UPI002B47AFB9|nr:MULTISPECIES: hypothetical protein [unclassified Parvimonas]MEB3024939.1 hypothetical protein [Parvimonas sp. M13]MEB3089292.1 hypothetical protein [Parvimonas sp. M20]